MNDRFLLLVLVCVGAGAGIECVFGGDLAKDYERVVADYQRVERSTQGSARSAAARLTQDAYRLILLKVDDQQTTDLDAADLYALGACHEALGDRTEATGLYLKSLDKKDSARTHLALVRTHVAEDYVQDAEQHFAAAVKLQPEFPDLIKFRNLLAVAYGRKQAWDKASGHHQAYVAYTKALLDKNPENPLLTNRHALAAKDAERMQRYNELVGEASPPLSVDNWLQGEAVTLDALKGKIIVLDFLVPWSRTSLDRNARLRSLLDEENGRSFELITLVQPFGYRYQENRVVFDRELKVEDEQQAALAFAKRYEWKGTLGWINMEQAQRFGMDRAGGTILIAQTGHVRMILPANGQYDFSILQTQMKIMESAK